MAKPAEPTSTTPGITAAEMRELLAEDRAVRRDEAEAARLRGDITELEAERDQLATERVVAEWAEQDAAIERAFALDEQRAQRAELIGSDTVEGALEVARSNGGRIPADRLTTYSNTTLKQVQKRDRDVWYESLNAYAAAAVGDAVR